MCHRCTKTPLPILAVMILALPSFAWAQSQTQPPATTEAAPTAKAAAPATKATASKPVAPRAKPMRDWKDVTGKHVIRASFLGVIDRTKVALKTEEGKEMTIELSRLSNVDIYEAVKLDLMSKQILARSVAAAPRRTQQPSTRKTKPTQRKKNQLSPKKVQVASPAIPASKPKPTVDDGLVAQIETFIETIENEDTDTIFQTILHPAEYAKFSASPNFEAGLEKFEKEKKERLLSALQSIDLDSIERKPGGKYQFKTNSSPISFKNYKGTWYLRN